jgi:hypothetical protein
MHNILKRSSVARERRQVAAHDDRKDGSTQARCDRVLGTLVVNHYDTLLNLIPNDEISIELVAPFEFTRLPSMQLQLLRGGSVRRFAERSFPSAEPEIAPSAVFPVGHGLELTRASRGSDVEAEKLAR